MVKRLMLLLLGLTVYVPVCLAALSDADDAADGYLTAGEYDNSAVTIEYNEELFVIGGGQIGSRQETTAISKSNIHQHL